MVTAAKKPWHVGALFVALLGWVSLGLWVLREGGAPLVYANVVSFLLPPLLVVMLLFMRRSYQTLKTATDLMNQTLAYPDALGKMCTDSVSQALQEQGEALEKATQKTADTVFPLLESLQKGHVSLSNVIGEAKVLDQSLQEHISHLETLVADVQVRESTLKRSLDQQSYQLNEIWTNITERSEGVGTMLRLQVGEATDASEKMHALITTLMNTVHSAVDTLSSSSQESVGALQILWSDMQGRASELQQGLHKSLGEVSESFGLLEKKTSVFRTALEGIVREQGESMESVCLVADQRVNHVHKAFGTRTKQMQTVMNTSMTRMEAFLEKFSAHTHKQVSQLQTQLVMHTEALAQTSQKAAQETQTVYERLRQEAGVLDSFSDRIVEQGKNLENSLSRQLHVLSEVSSEAGKQVHGLNRLLDEEATRVGEVADALHKKLFGAIKALHAESENTGHTLEETMKLITLSTEQFYEQSEKLTSVSMKIGMQLSENRENLKEQTSEVHDQAGQALDLVQKVHEAMLHNVEDMTEALHGVSGRLEALVQQLRTYAGDMSAAGDLAHQQMGTVGATLSKQAHFIQSAQESIGETLHRLVSHTNEQLHVLSHTVDSVSQGAQQTGEHFEKHIRLLVKASTDAAEKVAHIKETNDTSHRKLFVKTARLVMEDLNSLSIDVARLLNEPLSEADWKRYIKGDRTVFTRSLAAVKSQKLMSAIVEELKTKNEMRMYILRYVDAFQKLLDDAAEADPEWLLHSTFVTSDVGKLYTVLSSALEKTSR